jgi:glycosyltransferase involved in cell wall biosynthesis
MYNQNYSVLYGPEIWELQKHGGISRYYFELIKRIYQLNPEARACVPINNNSLAKNLETECIINIDQNRISTPTQINSIGELNNSKFKIYHATYYGKSNYRLLKKSGFKIVVTVYDLIDEKFSNKKFWESPRINLKKRAIKFADHLICISETTRNDLVEFYKFPEDNVSIIHLGADMLNSLDLKIDLPTNMPFLLFVGNRDGYKNFNNFLYAFAKSKKLKTSYNIIAFGGGPFTFQEECLIEKLKCKELVFQLSGDDAILKFLYKSAVALVYPSLYEGFGLPLIEAMQLDCPVIANKGGSIPEICGDAAIFFDGLSVDSICQTLELSLENLTLIENIVSKGKLNSLRFSWDKNAIKTDEIYSKLYDF